MSGVNPFSICFCVMQGLTFPVASSWQQRVKLQSFQILQGQGPLRCQQTAAKNCTCHAKSTRCPVEKRRPNTQMQQQTHLKMHKARACHTKPAGSHQRASVQKTTANHARDAEKASRAMRNATSQFDGDKFDKGNCVIVRKNSWQSLLFTWTSGPECIHM